MQAAIAPRGDARTFLTHFVGSGLDDDRHVVEKFRSLANGDIVPVPIDEPSRKGRRSKARRIIVSLKAVEKMRPARDEIIIATGSGCAGAGFSSGAGGPWAFSPTAASAADRRALADVPPARSRPGVRRPFPNPPTWREP